MPLKVSFHPLAELDLAESIEYYEERQPGLGWRFEQSVEEAVFYIARFPKIYPLVVDQKFRRAVIPKFPFFILFVETSSGIFSNC